MTAPSPDQLIAAMNAACDKATNKSPRLAVEHLSQVIRDDPIVRSQASATLLAMLVFKGEDVAEFVEKFS